MNVYDKIHTISIWTKIKLFTDLDKYNGHLTKTKFTFQVEPAKIIRNNLTGAEPKREGFSFRARNLGLLKLKPKF